MPIDAPYEPSPSAAVAEQVALYERTGGAKGGTVRDVPCVIVSSLGARTGTQRKTPLIRVEHEGRYAAVASMGGAPTHPVWSHNLTAHPDVVTVQDGPVVGDYVAHEATGAERDEWWARAVAVWPDYDAYQAKTDRQIPVFVLTPKV